MKIRVNQKVPVEAKTLEIHCKVRDTFSARLVDADGKVIHDQDDGYVPSFMPGDHFGDYVILDIDIETGQITNWKDIKPRDLEEWVNGAEE